MLQDGSEAYDANSGSAEAVIDGLIVVGVGRAQPVRSSVGFRHVQPESHFSQIGRAILVSYAVKLKSPELGLRVCQDIFGGRELHNILGISGTKSQALSSPDHLSAQS